ncbi:MAG: aminopeptidase [Cyclobacteriaceae bacterium]
MRRKVFYSVGGILLVLIVWNFNLIRYGIGQGLGQWKILRNAIPVQEVLADPTVPDSVKQKLSLVQEVRQYAIDSLGINDSNNYTTLYDQKGKDILWIVTGSRPFALEAKEWHFPFLGSVPYKGFFIYEKVLKEEAGLLNEGWDTNIRAPGGWSTLGWFKDPILSNMLSDSEGDLANTIIHELTHNTIFVKDSVELNENLASFIGDLGALRFLKHKFGMASPLYQGYVNAKMDRSAFIDHILRGADRLDSLYLSWPEDLQIETKSQSKKELIEKIITSVDTLKLGEKERFKEFLAGQRVNNAFFMSYLRYRVNYDFFEDEFNRSFKGDLKGYLDYLKQKYPSL